MKSGKLKFIGTGSSFNTGLGCNSGYILKDSSLILFDCGGDVFGRLKEMKILTKDLKSITVFITHLHPDHIGSLGDVIYFSYYILKEKLRLVCIEPNIELLLSLMGVPKEIYNSKIIVPNTINRFLDDEFKDVTYEAIETKHYPKIKSSGYIVEVEGTSLYYSGDCNEIPKRVLNEFICGRIEELYQDTCDLDYEDNPHLSISKLSEVIPWEHSSRVFCMHIDERLYNNVYKITKLGFNRVFNDYEIKGIEFKTKTAVYAGSFDPITKGHMNIIGKASKMYDKVVIGVLINSKKQALFSMAERLSQIKKCVEKYPNVQVKMFTGLLVDFAKDENAQIIVRGLRSVTDFEIELQIAMTNKKLNDDIETALLVPDMKYQFISSSLAKELALYNGDISWLIPEEIIDEVRNKM